jgi:hypothetical protein
VLDHEFLAESTGKDRYPTRATASHDYSALLRFLAAQRFPRILPMSYLSLVLIIAMSAVGIGSGAWAMSLRLMMLLLEVSLQAYGRALSFGAGADELHRGGYRPCMPSEVALRTERYLSGY